MTWPLSQDYNEAIQIPRAATSPTPTCAAARPVTNALGMPMPCSGNFADVYQVRCPDGARWAVKCFTREAPGPARALPGDQPAPAPGEAAVHGGFHLSGTGHPRRRASGIPC